MAEACPRCHAQVDESANFCPACGQKLGGAAGLSRAQIFCLLAVLIELAALAVIGLFVVPHMRAALLQQGGHHSAFTRTVFSELWVPPFVLPVLVLGALAVIGKKQLVTRIVLISVCMLIGLIPIFGTTMGIYVATFEAAGDVGQ